MWERMDIGTTFNLCDLVHPPSSQSPTVSSISSSSLRSSPSALHFPSGGSGRPRYKSPRPHSHTPTTFLPQDSIILTSTPASAGYIVTQPVSSGIVRPLAQVPSRPSKKRRALIGTGNLTCSSSYSDVWFTAVCTHTSWLNVHGNSAGQCVRLVS